MLLILRAKNITNVLPCVISLFVFQLLTSAGVTIACTELPHPYKKSCYFFIYIFSNMDPSKKLFRFVLYELYNDNKDDSFLF